MMPWTLYFFILIQLIFVSYLDVKNKKISNYWSIINFVAFVLLHLFLREHYQLSWQTFYYSFVFLVVGFTLFLLKVMGAGDTKYLVSFYLLIPPTLQEDAFVTLLFCTVIIGSALLFERLVLHHKQLYFAVKSRDISGFRLLLGGKFSFAPVILLSWIWFGWITRDSLF